MPYTILLPILAVVLSLVAALVWMAWRWRTERREWAALQARLEREYAAQQVESRRLAATAERERIYRDLHDDLGARLLDLVYRAPTADIAERGRGVLQQLRSIVSDAQRPASTLLDLLDELHRETTQRVEAAQRALVWEQDPRLPDTQFDQAETLHLLRIVREAVTNALRHAHLQRLRVRSFGAADQLLFDISDDGEYADETIGSGSGTRTMRARAEQLGGDIAWHAGTWGGTKVTLRVPLRRQLRP